ncbi:NAD(P)-dependent dehydrogenase (short-subunit alcohol dehydrogenase family) [Planomicrobium stackebrandtii]|uniref:NAD(P)-dependent dehydrogenase (Short-subunit alcohol dehydrogenase family) n=1 Tax=Planomicrobium stackebrandtii TaxID=253160 RepID=A0ABU0GTJ1_9BACL|nr:oxidoreductase [Planomicrobium stackebrandtii]MDQ0428675.1 NAD(P)-dependent dehydrogenase (short-subunit alcohol dehydrogenase family) [Planomicrobium stackebrandtii]
MKQLTGKTAIITGANSGIGLEAAKAFAERGAHVIMAVRNTRKGDAARDLIIDTNKDALVTVMKLDLADLASVRVFAESFKSQHKSLDLLINNAGVMTPPYSKTKDGFEMQFGSNHLGHFALTGLLLPLLKNTAESRVVSLSSLAHKGASIDFDNLDGAKGYKAMRFYGQSKLANLLFAQELDKRFKQNDLNSLSLACHPGISATNLFKFGKRDAPKLMKTLMHNFLQPQEMGALPTVYAATDLRLIGGEYIGPDGKGQRKGYPTLDTPHAAAGDEAVSRKLWEVSEQLTGVKFDFNEPVIQ